MAGFGDALRGDGLARAQKALAGLQGDPLLLDRGRQRFSHSPLPYTSNPSGTTTRSASPIPPSEERREERRFQLRLERRASEPDKQFSHQISDEEKRIFEADLNATSRIPIGSDPRTIARENVKKLWVEQGIWNNKWNQFAYGRWKHEEPLELESESETDIEAESSHPPFSFLSKEPQPKLRLAKSDEEKQQIAERRVVREREREASRPYHQFVHQVSKERKRIQEESANKEGADAADINTRAYEIVKNTWTKRGIWITRWGILPGMSWKHEEPLEEEATDGPILVSETTLRNAQLPVNHEAANKLFEPLPLVESIHREASADIDSAGLENCEAPGMSKRALHPTKGQALRRNRRKHYEKDGQPQPVASASFSQVHSLKVSKAAGKTKHGRQRRLNISQEVSFGGLLLSSGVDVAQPQPSPPPNRVTPRRSKRIQSSVPSVAKDSVKTASTNLLERAARSKPERKVASNLTKNSAKPQGVSKRPEKTTRGKARKK